MSAVCADLEGQAPAAAPATACEDCVADGTTWVHLRRCDACGRVGCCDSSPRRHATAHHGATGHPTITSAEQGESWRWCYLHEVMSD